VFGVRALSPRSTETASRMPGQWANMDVCRKTKPCTPGVGVQSAGMVQKVETVEKEGDRRINRGRARRDMVQRALVEAARQAGDPTPR